MTTTLNFQRARKPQEREIRREAILAAAAELFDGEGPQGAGLNAIAARAGFTKSNVYRYFESREDVLLSLFLVELERMVPELERRIGPVAPGDIDAIAAAIASTFVSRPRLASLSTIVSSTLEQNVSEPAVIALKRGMSVQLQQAATIIQRKLPGTSAEDCAWATAMVGTLVAGMWPAAHPSDTARRVLAMPEFAHLKPSIEHDLERATRALLASLPASPSRE